MKFEITSGKDTTKGIKTLIYGTEGIGKTTLASQFPDPVFIDTEGSTTHFDNIKRLPKPLDWKELKDMIAWVSQEKPCQTLVIDTFDWAEMAEVDALCKENGWRSIESPGYGKGFTESAERIGGFLRYLETKLVDEGINVVLNCHAQTEKIELPEEQSAYDKYGLKLGSKTKSRTSALVKEWADMVLFCNYKTYVESVSSGMTKKGKATGGKERVMYAEHSAVWDAKNRFGLPAEMPMEYKQLAKIFDRKPKAQPVKPAPKKKEPKPEPVKEEPMKTEVFDTDSLAVTWPDSVPKTVRDICKKNSFMPDDIQRLLYNENIVKTPNFDLAKVPPKFWTSFTSEFETRWGPKLDIARQDNLPF